MDKQWLETFFQEQDLWPNRTGQSPIEAGEPHFGGRYDYDEKLDNKHLNLGLGWIYYSLARLYKPQNTLIIGSGRGFLPITIAKGMVDNDSGICHFIDPSFYDDFWKDPQKVTEWFAKFGVDKKIKHYLTTTQDFVLTDIYKNLRPLDMLCIDGDHFYEGVKFDYEAFKDKISDRAIILLHDTISRSKNPKWSGPRKLLIEILEKDNFQVFDFKFGAGLTILQKKYLEHEPEYIKKLEKEWPENNEIF